MILHIDSLRHQVHWIQGLLCQCVHFIPTLLIGTGVRIFDMLTSALRWCEVCSHSPWLLRHFALYCRRMHMKLLNWNLAFLAGCSWSNRHPLGRGQHGSLAILISLWPAQGLRRSFFCGPPPSDRRFVLQQFQEDLFHGSQFVWNWNHVWFAMKIIAYLFKSSMLRSLDSTQDLQPSLHSGVNWGPKVVSLSYVVSVTGSSDRSIFPRIEHLHLFIQFCGELELSSIES